MYTYCMMLVGFGCMCMAVQDPQEDLRARIAARSARVRAVMAQAGHESVHRPDMFGVHHQGQQAGPGQQHQGVARRG